MAADPSGPPSDDDDDILEKVIRDAMTNPPQDRKKVLTEMRMLAARLNGKLVKSNLAATD